MKESERIGKAQKWNQAHEICWRSSDEVMGAGRVAGGLHPLLGRLHPTLFSPDHKNSQESFVQMRELSKLKDFPQIVYLAAGLGSELSVSQR